MTYVVSSLLPVKQALFDLLSDASGTGGPLAKIQVSYGYPGSDAVERRAVWIARGSSTQEWAQLGAGARNETANVRIVCHVHSHDGGDQLELEQEVWPIANAVGELIAGDLQLDHAGGAYAAGISEVSDAYEPEAGNRAACQVVLTVEIDARPNR